MSSILFAFFYANLRICHLISYTYLFSVIVGVTDLSLIRSIIHVV